MDSRIALSQGTELHFSNRAGGAVVYTICREIGRGASCIVYDATYEASTGDQKRVRIKECYPYKLHLHRLPSGALSPDPEEEEAFRQARARFARDFKVGNGLFYSDDLFDALTNSLDLYDSNGTAYLISAFSSETTLADYRPATLKDCLTILKQVARILSRLHTAGYLYLDLKPENILVADSYTLRVQLFDLDSLISMADLEHPDLAGGLRLSYTRGFAPLELQTNRLSQIGPHTDVYSQGALLFYLVYGAIPTAEHREEDAIFDESGFAYASEAYGDKFWFALTDFFHHTLASYCRDRFSTMGQAIEALEQLERMADGLSPFLCSTEVVPPQNFVGRTKELQRLGAWMKDPDGRCMVVTGMGGIGKSTLVRQAIGENRAALEAVLYLSYHQSLEQTLTDDRLVAIHGVSRQEEEKAGEYYARKLRAFARIARQTRVLLVLDDYTGPWDQSLQEIFGVGWKVLILSRCQPEEGGYPVLALGAMEEPGALEQLFAQHLQRPVLPQEHRFVNHLIARVAGHTMTVELMARQIASSYLTLAQASALADQHGFSGIAPEKVYFVKDHIQQYEQVRNLLTALFQADAISPALEHLLKIMSCIGRDGINLQLFCRLLELTTKDPINELIRNGWMQRTGLTISLHPVIRETVCYWPWTPEAWAGAEKLLGGLSAWLMEEPSESRMALAESVLEECRKMPVIQESPAYAELLYCALEHMPRTREEFLLPRAEELLQHPRCPGGLERMKVYRLVLSVDQERRQFDLGARRLREAEQLARQVRQKEVWALFYDIQSEFYDFLLDGAYDARQPGEKAVFRKLMAALDRAIRWSRAAGGPAGEEQLIKNLLAKATVLMRSSPRNRRTVRRLLAEVETHLSGQTGKNPELLTIYWMVCGWYASVMEPSLERTEECLSRAADSFAGTGRTDLDRIDEVVVPSADIYCGWACFERAAGLLQEAIAICETQGTVLPWLRKKLELWRYLLDVCFEWGKPELCKALIRAIEDENARYAYLGIHQEISRELRETILER